jgi:hypothetical protein
MAGKSAGLRVRIERGLREEFLRVCRAQDKPAAQVLREFMRSYVATHASADGPIAPSDKSRKATRRVKGE